jgi:hypothetical protein
MIKKILFMSMVLIFSQLSCLDTLNDAYDAKSDIPRSGLVGEWLFEGNANDTSGSNNNGTLAGGSGTTSPSLGAGYRGQAYNFDDLTDDIMINGGVTNPLNVNYITVSFHIYPTAYGKIIMKDDENGSNIPGTYQIEISNGNKIEFTVFTGTGRLVVLASGGEVSMNRWYHIACTFNGSMLRIYMDGELNLEKSSEGVASLFNHVTNFNTYIGMVNSTVTDSFEGVIDTVRIYNRALSEVEIKLLANE